MTRKLPARRLARRGQRPTSRTLARCTGCVAVAVLAVLSEGCAGAIAPVSQAAPSQLRVSWSVRSGPLGGDSAEVCRSDLPGPCVVQASTAARPRTASVSVFLDAGGTPTTYTGAVLVGFIANGGAPGYEMNLRNYQVDPSDRPAGIAVAGPMTTQAGQYDIEIALLARVPGRLDPRQLSRMIPVRVEAPEG
jgi:hypothetical protein